MPRNYTDPAAFSNAFNTQRVMGAQMREADQNEQIRGEQIARQQAINALGKNPQATPEDYIRAGDAQAGNALSGQQGSRMKGQEWLGTYAARAKQSGDPQQARAIMREALQIAAPQKLADFDAQPDDMLAKQIEQFAAFAPPQESGTKVGAFQPGDYTPESFAKFQSTGNAADLVRYTTPRQEFSPSFQSITRTLADGSTQMGTFDSRSGTKIWDGPIVPAGQKARTDAQGKVEGEAVGAQAAKEPGQKSMAYVMDQMRSQLTRTPQGGFLGVEGRAGAVTNYDASRRFDNLREQLSTEMRSIFRIPGEGTLSDQEQKQYSVQLPDRANSREVNAQILNDIENRVSRRLTQPGAEPAAPTQEQPQQPPSQQSPAPQAAPLQIGSDEEYAQLPSGTRYVGPDGKTRVKR